MGMRHKAGLAVVVAAIGMFGAAAPAAAAPYEGNDSQVVAVSAGTSLAAASTAVQADYSGPAYTPPFGAGRTADAVIETTPLSQTYGVVPADYFRGTTPLGQSYTTPIDYSRGTTPLSQTYGTTPLGVAV